MRVLVTGDRNWTDYPKILDVLRLFPKGTVIIHGDCRGADRMAAAVGTSLGFEVIAYPADWARLGLRAGPIRNTQMLKEGAPDVVVAFHTNIDASRGTKDMVTKAQAAGVRVVICSTLSTDSGQPLKKDYP